MTNLALPDTTDFCGRGSTQQESGFKRHYRPFFSVSEEQKAVLQLSELGIRYITFQEVLQIAELVSGD